MAIQSAEAKLLTGIRCWCVDKNITANLTSSFSMGNHNRPTQPLGQYIVYPNVLATRLYRFICDMELAPAINLTNERYKTYGGGNNVITPAGVDNTNNAKIVSTLVCKFPTYLRIDVEKLGLPEGTDCIVEFEEGFITEGDYPGSLYAPSPEVKNFFQFRTPWFGVSRLTTSSSITSLIGMIKGTTSSLVTASASITANGVLNPGKFASLIGGSFAILPTAVKKTGILFAQLPYSMGFDLAALAGKLLTAISNNSITTSMSTDSEFSRIRRYTAALITPVTFVADARKKTDIVLDSLSSGNLIANARVDFVASSTLVAESNVIANAAYTTTGNTLTINSTSSFVLPRADGYPYDYSRSIALDGQPSGLFTNGSNRLIRLVAGGTDANRDNFSSKIYNLDDDTSINVTGVVRGANSTKFLTTRGNRLTPSTLYQAIWNYQGQQIGSITNVNSLPEFGDTGFNAIGTNYAYISWLDYTMDGISSNESPKIEVVNLSNNSRTALPTQVSGETLQSYGGESDTYVMFSHASSTNNLVAFSVFNKNTNTLVRTHNFSTSYYGYMSGLGINESYYGIMSTKSTDYYIKIYSVTTGAVVYQLSGLAAIQTFLGFNENYVFRKTNNLTEVIDIVTQAHRQTISDPENISNPLYFGISTSTNLILRRASNTTTSLIFNNLS